MAAKKHECLQPTIVLYPQLYPDHDRLLAVIAYFIAALAPTMEIANTAVPAYVGEQKALASCVRVLAEEVYSMPANLTLCPLWSCP